ncbi:MAG: site-2 protease family protein [Arenimonas sp.]
MSDKAPAKTFTLKKIFSIVVFAVLGMGVGFFIGKAIKTMPELTSRLDALQMWDLLLLPISFLFVLAVHEAGHLLGGFRKGMRFLLYIVGPFQLTRTASGIRFNWIFNLGTFGGLAAATPDPEQPIRPQFLSLIAGGPLASLLLAALGVAVFLFTDGRFSAHALLLALFSALFFLVTAVPSRAGGFMSDGMQFIEVLRGGDAVMERQQLTGLMAQSMAGIRPRDWKAEWLEPAAQAGVGDPMRRVAVRLMALLRAEDSGDTATADAHADWLAEHTDDYPQGVRQSLTIELCLHALSRGNATAAKMWMAQSKGGVVDKARRALAEAELALAEGDKSRALGKELEARTQLKHGMDAGLTLLTAERLQALLAKMANSPGKSH